MEEGGSVGWALVGVVVAGLLGWICLRRSRQLVSPSKSKPTLPPGSMGWPFVGETLEIFSNGLLNKWADFYVTRAAKYGEVRSEPSPPRREAFQEVYQENLCPGRTGGQLQMNRFSLRKNRLKFETSGEITIILEESILEYTSNEYSETGR